MSDPREYRNKYITLEGSDQKYYITEIDIEQEMTDEITRLRSLLTRMAEVGDEMAKENQYGDMHYGSSTYCKYQNCHMPNDVHTPSCPVTKWQELKKEMEG